MSLSNDSGDALPKVGFIIQFTGDQAYEGKFFKIMQRESLEYTTGATSGTPEFSTVASGGASGFKDISVLESDKSHLRAAYVEFGFRDGCVYQIKMKSGTIRDGPDGDKNSARLDARKSPWYDPDPTYAGWFFGQDWFPSFNAINITPWAITPIIYFRGYKYEMVQLVPQNANGMNDQNQINQSASSGRVATITLGGVPS